MAQAPDEESALSAARRQGSRVEVADLRTPTRTVFADPGGTFTAELSVVPSRVRRGDSWVRIDTTMARGADGTVAPRAAVGDLSLSGGGSTTPLARLVKDGKSFALRWPEPLPTPTLAGGAATYPDVLPGVDLVMYALPNGYRQHLVIKSAEAARNPALARIRFPVETSGVRLSVEESGAVRTVDATGEPVFVAPPSTMWDASGTRSARVEVAAQDGSLILRPDPAFLADPAVVFPVVVDPDMQTWHKSAWATVLSGKANTPFWMTSGAGPGIAQVGQCHNGNGDCNNIGAARAYFQYETSFLAGRRIISSVLNSTVLHSPNCDSHAHQLYRTNGQIDSGTTWNNAPPGVSLTDITAPPGPGCAQHQPLGAGTINNGGLTTYFFKAANEGDQLAWRKLDPAATTLSVTYNTGPFRPSDLGTIPPLPAPCRWCDGTPYLGDDSIRWSATLSDPDNDQVKPKWITIDNGHEFVDWGVLQNSGATHDISIDLRSRHDRRIRWQVQTWDTLNGNPLDASDWAFSPGEFVVDRVGVTVPPTVSGVLYREDNRWHGGVGVPDTFTFGANGVGDIDHYLWGWSDPPTNRVDAANHLSDDASVLLTPPGDGPRDLFVQSVDRAGHRSPTRVYHFFVRAGSGPLGHWALDGNATDTAFLGDRHGAVSGPATWGPGAVDTAMQLAQDASATAPPVVRTDTSFSVSAWVRLAEGSVPRVAVSQVDSRVAGFELGYRPENGGRWAFLMPQANTDNPIIDKAASAQLAQLNTWTHLTGVYDAAASQQRLYVNGVLAGTVAHTSRWHAASDSRIGASRWNGARDGYWRGAIDEVQIYDRVVAEPEVRAAVGRDDVAASSWKFDDEQAIGGQPNTITRNSVEGGSSGILSNGATLVEQGAVKGAVRFDGVDDQMLTNGPAVRTDQSFSVAAWVKADRLVTGTHMTAVSQLGGFNQGFSLQYNSGHQRWLFITPSTDSETATWEGAVSSQLPATGQWTHLAGVYDAAAQRLRIYVNGEFGGISRPWTMTWNATGSVAVGRGMWRGGLGEHWPGSIDEVRLYGRALSDAEVRAVVSQNNVTSGTWKLDGDANDSSGRDQHGVPTGGPRWTNGQGDNPDPRDSAILLDGIDDHVRAAPALNTETSFSVAAWAKLSVKRTVWGSVVSQNGSHTAAFNLAYAGNVDRWAFAMHGPDSDNPSSVVRVLAGQPAQQGVWTHLTAVFDATSGEMRLYVNGQHSATDRFTAPWNATGELDIGRARWTSNWIDHFPGAIDDVTVYNRPLFSDEIRALAGRDLNLVHNWRLDETAGPAADSVGARGGTLAGGATFTPGRVNNAIHLDGVDDVVSTTGVDLRTDQSFAVAAWVYLDSADRTVTAVSLDGPQVSKFRLGHVVDSDHRDGAWTFECPEPDGTVTEAAVSRLPGEVGTWVHLVGVYDVQTGRIWLYVNGSRIDDGVVNTPWHASGGLQIGRGKANGASAEFWPGSVDDVRLYTGAVDRDRVRALHDSYPRG